MHVSSQESGRLRIYVLGVLILSTFLRFFHWILEFFRHYSIIFHHSMRTRFVHLYGILWLFIFTGWILIAPFRWRRITLNDILGYFFFLNSKYFFYEYTFTFMYIHFLSVNMHLFSLTYKYVQCLILSHPVHITMQPIVQRLIKLNVKCHVTFFSLIKFKISVINKYVQRLTCRILLLSNFLY